MFKCQASFSNELLSYIINDLAFGFHPSLSSFDDYRYLPELLNGRKRPAARGFAQVQQSHERFPGADRGMKMKEA